MRKFRFRLEGVLRVRRVQEELARAELQAANHDLSIAVARVGDRRAYYAALARPAGVQSFADVEHTMFTLDHAAGAIGYAVNEQVVATERVHEARATWAAAEQCVRALERLREHAQTEHTRAVHHEEDRIADDISTTRYRNQAINA